MCAFLYRYGTEKEPQPRDVSGSPRRVLSGEVEESMSGQVTGNFFIFWDFFDMQWSLIFGWHE